MGALKDIKCDLPWLEKEERTSLAKELEKFKKANDNLIPDFFQVQKTITDTERNILQDKADIQIKHMQAMGEI